MEQVSLNKKIILNCKTPIKIFSLISLVFTFLSCITYFIYYDYEYINGEDVYELAVRPLSILSAISFLLTILPAILLVLYIFKFHSKLKATVLVPIIFGVLGLNAIFNFLFAYGYYYGWIIPYGMYRILELLMFVSLILATISALKGFNKKIFVIISMSICLLYTTISLLEMFAVGVTYYINKSLYLYLFTSPLGIIGAFLLYAVLLLFALKNKIPPIFSPKKEIQRVEELDPEQALKLLKDKLDCDMITEEEYQAQRAEIISKL